MLAYRTPGMAVAAVYGLRGWFIGIGTSRSISEIATSWFRGIALGDVLARDETSGKIRTDGNVRSWNEEVCEFASIDQSSGVNTGYEGNSHVLRLH